VADQVMLWCDHKNYTVALVVPDPGALGALAASNPGLEATLRAVEADLQRFKADPTFAGRFPAPWCPSAFALVTEPFTEQNRMINSTLKMVRFRIAEAHAETLADLYTEAGRPATSARNQAALGHWLDLQTGKN
jgi:long-chain acyl-CoA synthetase